MTRTDYENRFETVGEAVEFEHNTLSIGDEFLPASAVAVRRGATEPFADYWAWLCAQIDGMEA